MKLARGIAIALAIAIGSAPLAAYPCGKERWSVKVATDKTKDKVEPTPVPTTIDKLRKIDAPVNPNARKDSRYAPTELTVYEITGVLSLIKKEADEDYHLVIKDNNGRTMIIESSSPNCAKGSRFEQDIQDVRKAIDAELGAIAGKKTPNRVITVTGIGFFDPLHGQTGVAPNGIELHPLLSIEFHPDKTVDALKKRTRVKREEPLE